MAALAWLLLADAAYAQAPPATGKGQVVGLAFVNRSVANLDRSLQYYKAIGFTQDPGVDSGWHRDAATSRLFGFKGAQVRTARLIANSNVSGKPFVVYLRELKGIRRRNVTDHTPWEPGANHFGLVVPDANGLWAQLKSSGMLKARSWGAELIALPGQTKGALAYVTDPDGLDIEIIDQRPATPAADGRPARPASPPGISHVGLIILDSDKGKAFYGDLLGGLLQDTEAPWMQGDFYDSAVGGHGNILRFYNLSFAEAAAADSRLNFEMVEFQNRKKAVESYGMADIGVGGIAFEVQGLDALLSRVKATGATVVSDGGVVALPDGTRAVLVRDPDVGGFVELFERPRR